MQKDSWEISNSEWAAMQREQLQKRNQDRDFYEANKVMNRGPLLPNGKYEWLSFGGGYRRVWSDKAGGYVDPPRNLLIEPRPAPISVLCVYGSQRCSDIESRIL